MEHKPKEFLLTGLTGLSDEQISQHRDILYVGYINKLNEIEEKLKAVELSSANQVYSDLRALKVEESFALNGVILHELYFENLGKGAEFPGGKFADMLMRDFGDKDAWLTEFKACGMAARGWVVLALNHYDERLHNYCLDAHNASVPVNATPLLVMDVYEHAYAIDFGVKRPPYIEVFAENINWSVVEDRFNER